MRGRGDGGQGGRRQHVETESQPKAFEKRHTRTSSRFEVLRTLANILRVERQTPDLEIGRSGPYRTLTEGCLHEERASVADAEN